MTTQSILIRRFRPDEVEVYKSLRMNALADAPYAFGSTLAEAQSRTQHEWQQRFNSGVKSDLDLALIAEAEWEPAGLVWGKIGEDQPATAHLYQMWVAPAWRKKGIGAKLVQAVIEWAREMGAARLELDVTLNNPPAVALYEGLGFIPFDDPHPLRPGEHLMSQSMVLLL